MAREQLPEVNFTEAVQPRAQIYDTYVRPAEVSPSPLHAVARALGPLSQELFSLSQQQMQEQAAKDEAAGQAAYWNKNAEGDAAGVASGAIPAQSSRAFQRGYAGMAAIGDASKLNQTIGPDYTALDKTTEDPNAFDKWFFPYVQSKANPAMVNNPAYAKVWAAQVAQLHNRMSNQYVQDRSDTLKTKAFEMFTGGLGNAIDEHFYGSGGAPDATEVGTTLNGLREVAIKTGMPKDQVDKSVIDTVSTKALTTKDPGILDALSQMPVDPANPTGPKLGETQYGVAKIEAARREIQTRGLQDLERQRKEQDRQDKEAANTTYTSVLTKWSKDLNYIPSEAEIGTISKVHPEFRSTMGTLRENILKNDTVEDPKALTTLYEDIYRTGDAQTNIDRALRTGTIKTKKSLEDAIQFGNTVENTLKSGGSARISDDPTAKSYEQAIISHSKDPALFGSMFAEQGLTDAGRRALLDFRVGIMQWAAQNPNASPIERATAISQLGEGIVGRIKNNQALGLDPATKSQFSADYQAAPGAPSTGLQTGQPSPTPVPAPQTAPAAPQGQQPAPQGAPAPAPQRQGAAPINSGADLAKAFSQLPAAPNLADLPNMGVPRPVIEGITAGAKAMGQDPQQFINEMWRRVHDAASPGKQGAIDFELPGGGKVSLAGVSPEVADQMRQMVQRMARVGETQQQQQASSEVGSSMVNSSRVAQIDRLPVRSTIEQVAKEEGFPADKLKAIVSIESSGNPDASTGSYHGLLQLSKAEFTRYGDGTGHIKDPVANLRAGIRSLKEKEARFQSEFGRAPSATELYLMHQQGEAGLRAHENNLDQPAWESMRSTGEGRQKGDRWSKAAIWGNVPSDMKPLFGSVNNITSRQFIAVWMHKLEGTPYEQALASIGKGGPKLASAE